MNFINSLGILGDIYIRNFGALKVLDLQLKLDQCLLANPWKVMLINPGT